MKLTAEEKAFIKERRAREEEEKPKKTGILKEDLYCFNAAVNLYHLSSQSFFFSREEIDEEIEIFRGRFKLVLKAGTKFECYIEDGEECWFDCSGDCFVEEASKEWAEKYLTNIKAIKGKKS